MPVYRFKHKGLRDNQLRESAGNVPPLTISDIGNAGYIDVTADVAQLIDLTAAMAEQGFVYDTTDPVTTVEEASAVEISHLNLSNIGTNTHAQIDTHIASTSNPHATTAAQVGADPSGTASAAVAAHEALGDPHPQYLTTAEGNAAYAPIGNGVTNGNSHDHNGGDGAQISHLNLSNIGTNTHAQIDTFVASKAAASGLASLDTNTRLVQAANTLFDGTAARSANPIPGANVIPVTGAGSTIAAGFIPDLSATYAPAAQGVTNGNTHDHSGGDGAQINHTTLSNIGTNTHAQIDTHIASTSNPHATTAAQVGADAVGTAAAAVAAHELASDPHPQYNYTLPIASPTTLGGIKIGTGLTIDGGGVVSTATTAPVWGDITGTLADQTDLQTALNGKENTGVAASLITAHESAGDPHPQYLTAAEGNAAYAPIGNGVTNGNTHDHNGGDGAQISHLNLSNIGTNTHAQIDTFIASKAAASGLASLDTNTRLVQPANTIFDGTAARSATPTPGANVIPVTGAGSTIAAGFIPDLSATYAPAAQGVTNGNSHDHNGGDGAQISHLNLSNIGTNTHAQIDTHIASTSNPHATTAAQVGADATGTAAAAVAAHEAALDPHPQYDSNVIPTLGALTWDTSGWPNRTDTEFSFDAGTRTVSFGPTGASATVYLRGNQYTIDSVLTFQIPDVSGGRYIDYDPILDQLYDAGSTGGIMTSILAVYVYWDAITQTAIIVGDERHGAQRDTTWHYSQHRDVGTRWRSGGAITYTTNDDAELSFSLGDLVIADEDLEHDIVHSATPTAHYEQILTPAAVVPTIYLSGTSYTQTTASAVPWIAGTSFARYNQITAGVGSLVDAAEGQYITYWIVATNDVTYPVKVIVGREAFNTIDGAYGESFVGYDLPYPEVVPLYQVILQTSAAYINTPKVVIASVRKITTRTNVATQANSATSHDALSGRSLADQHPIDAITGLTAALAGKQETLVSGTNIKTINGTTILGAGDIDTGLTAHIAAGDPHPQYLTAAEGNAAYDVINAASTAISNHVAAGDPHPQYLTAAEGNAAYAPIGNGVTNGDSHDHNGGDGAQISHLNLSNIGTNTHAQIDTFVASKAAASGLASLDTNSRVVQAANTLFDGTAARSATPTPGANVIPVTGAGSTIAAGFIPDLSATYAPAAQGVTNGNTHDHNGGDGAQISHLNLSNIGTNTHAQIDTFIASKAAASGLASLDANTRLVQPATTLFDGTASRSATATPGANVIPVTGAGSTIAAGFIPDLSATYAPAAQGVTNGNSHDHNGGDGAQISHLNLSNIGTNTHAQLDTFVASKAAASGLASLDANTRLVQAANTLFDGTAARSATATPGANVIPVTGAGSTIAAGFIPDLSATYAPAAQGVTNGNTHDHNGGDGAQISHLNLSNIGTNTHAQIDTHIANTSNPHATTAAQVGALATTAFVGLAKITVGTVQPVSPATGDLWIDTN